MLKAGAEVVAGPDVSGAVRKHSQPLCCVAVAGSWIGRSRGGVVGESLAVGWHLGG